MVLALADDTSIELYAYDLATLSSAGPLPYVNRLTKSTEVDVLVFAAGLATLGLTPGAFQPAQAGVSLFSTTPTIALTALVTAKSGFPGWSPLAAPTRALASVLVPGDTRTPCETFQVNRLVIDNGDGVGTLSVPLDHSLLYATDAGHFFEITPTAATLLPTLTSTHPSIGAWRDDAGQLWLFGDGGVVATGSLEHGFVPAQPNPWGGLIHWFAGRGAGANLTLYAMNRGGVLSLYSGGGWSMIATEPQSSSFSHGLAVVWPDDVYTTAGERSTVIHYHLGVPITEQPPTDLPLYALVNAPGIGIVAASSQDGRLFASMPGMGWTQLGGGAPPDRLAVAAYAISTLGTNGVFVAGALGATTEYFSGYGFCPPGQYAASPIRTVHRLGDDVILLPDEVDSDGKIVITWLKRM
jgi:hypothetical protein